jgi:hypothetical protein
MAGRSWSSMRQATVASLVLAMACGRGDPDDPIAHLRAAAPSGIAVVLQTADCASREGELRVVTREVSELHVVLLHSSKREGSAGLDMVKSVFSTHADRVISTRAGRTLVQRGVSATPALLAWSAHTDSVVVVVLEPDRSNLRDAIRWANTALDRTSRSPDVARVGS